MTVGIVGLGLIGGSFAKCYHEAGWQVLAFDTDKATYDFAVLNGAVNGELNKESISECDLVLICVFPNAAEDYMKTMAQYIGKKPLVIDCCGTKREVCEACFTAAEAHGVAYVGGHPMAGTHNSGFKFSRAGMFKNASMVLVPPEGYDIALIDRVKTLLAPAGFGRFPITTAEKHDEMIAFTSQMPHLVSNAFIKSPVAGSHKGFSAGSYKDLTRVAWLSPVMWAELFLDNREYLLQEIDVFVENVLKYKDAIEANDRDALIALLDEGRRIKEEVDGR